MTMTVCVLQNLEKYRVLWTDFSATCREINWLSVSKIGPELAFSFKNRYRTGKTNDFSSPGHDYDSIAWADPESHKPRQ